MLKAGANEGATGENAIVVNVEKVDIIVGSVAISFIPHTDLTRFRLMQLFFKIDASCIATSAITEKCGVFCLYTMQRATLMPNYL